MLQYITGMHRKLLFFVLLCSPSTFYGAIVFVHIGSQIPDYLPIALEQARLFNPYEDMYLIANQEAVDQTTYDFSQHNFSVVLCESLERSIYHNEFEKKSPLSTTFRDGIWKKSSERFFYLHEFIASRNLKNVIHLENDTMLYVDISTLRGAFSNYQGIGAVFDCDQRCIPCFVYIAHPKAIEQLVAFMAEHAAEGQNDMGILATYRRTVSEEYIDNLPLIMPEYTQRHVLINDFRQRPRNAEKYCNYFWFFQSIFDGAALGQYLGGVDPKNGPSQPGFINETCLFNPSRLKFEWRKDGQGRKVPFAKHGTAFYRINNLHIHSKRLADFRSI